MSREASGLALLLLLMAGPAAAQTPDPAASITQSDIRRRIEIIADDSMMGRDTPSAGLERAAAYVAGEFRRLGLRPAGERGYEQRWTVSRWIPDTAESIIELAAGGARVRARLGVDARYLGGALGGGAIAGTAVLLDGGELADTAGVERLRDRIVLLPPDDGRTSQADLMERVERVALRAAAVLIVSKLDSTGFARAARPAPRLSPDHGFTGERAPVLEIDQRAFGRMPTGTPIQVSLRLTRRFLERTRAPNLLGSIEGADPALGREYVVLSAHLDGVGIRPGAADSINNGADDNASGVAGLLELAEAFSRGPRPGRSLLFFVSSGEEQGLWGSEYFVKHPTVPLPDLAAVVNLDLIGRNWPDSVIVVGPEFTTLGSTLDRVTASHPELRMAPLADRWPEERIFYRSDHYHFARRGVPVLFFTSGTHADYHQPTDTADRVDAEKTARLARLLYHLVAEIADDPARPRWDPEQYRAIVREP